MFIDGDHGASLFSSSRTLIKSRAMPEGNVTFSVEFPACRIVTLSPSSDLSTSYAGLFPAAIVKVLAGMVIPYAKSTTSHILFVQIHLSETSTGLKTRHYKKRVQEGGAVR
jgi:hypothetical protein